MECIEFILQFAVYRPSFICQALFPRFLCVHDILKSFMFARFAVLANEYVIRGS